MKIFNQSKLLVLVMGGVLVSGLLIGCGKKEEDPVPYKGQPGDKLPQPRGMSSGPGGAAKPKAAQPSPE